MPVSAPAPSTAPSTARSSTPAGSPGRAARAFPPLVGLTSLLILLQSVEAGVFLQSPEGGRKQYSSWIDIHGAGSDLLLVLSLVTAIVAVRGLRDRRELVVGSVALFVVVAVETALGHLINGSLGGSDHDAVTIVHIPLAMALIGLTVWLATRAAQLRRSGMGAARMP